MSAAGGTMQEDRPPRRRAVRAAMSVLTSLIAVAVCLGLTAVLLAALPTAGEDARSFRESLGIIGRTLYERVLLPRPPHLEAGYRNWVLTLQSATPILLTGLAVAVAFRANVLNIGGQGQYVAGAVAGTAVALSAPVGTPAVLIVLHLGAAVVAGAMLASIAAGLALWRNVPVVLSTLLLNFVALEVLRYLLQGPMRATSDGGTLLDPQSRQLPEAARLPEFFAVNGGQGIHLGFFVAVGVALVLAVVLRRTTFGFRLRVVGENPEAARFAGIGVARVSFATLALSGGLAGLAGGVQVSGVATHVLFPDVGIDGLGFTGIAVALLGRLSPVGVVFSALFFGLLNTAFRALERSPLEVHAATAVGVQGALVLAILVVTSPQWAKHLRRRGRGRRGADSNLRTDL